MPKGRDSGMPVVEQWEGPSKSFDGGSESFVPEELPESYTGSTMLGHREGRRLKSGRRRSNVEPGASKRDSAGFGTKLCPDHRGIGAWCLKGKAQEKRCSAVPLNAET